MANITLGGTPVETLGSLPKIGEKAPGFKLTVSDLSTQELSDFEEVGACGTAAVITPIGKISDPDANHTYTYGEPGVPGKTTRELYDRLVGIQYGDIQDKFDWITILD